MEEQNTDNKNKGVNNYIKYSAIGFQMLATIAFLTFIGYKIDGHQKNKTPYFTAAFSLLGVIVAIFQVIRQLNSNK